MWIHNYPHDFVVGGAAGALNALVKSIISKTHLLHYGSDFLPFLESRPTKDEDAVWALKGEESPSVSDEEDEEERAAVPHPQLEPDSPSSLTPSPFSSNAAKIQDPRIPSSSLARERKSSLPLQAKTLSGLPEPPPDQPVEEEDLSPKQTIRELLKISQELQAMNPDDVAQEITRIETKLLLQIKVCRSYPRSSH